MGWAPARLHLYQFRVGDFALTHHDASGPNKELAPQVYDALRALPKTDVEVASVQGFGQFTNGGRDFRLMVDALRPQELVPGHHDNWLPGLSSICCSRAGAATSPPPGPVVTPC